MYVIARYSIHLWDINQEGTWERRGTFGYYAELIFELTALCFDFIHHLHMLVCLANDVRNWALVGFIRRP